MPDPLAVRINDGTTDRHVTKYVSGLGWTKTAPGGHQGLKFRLNLPRRVFNDLGPADKCWVYDAATGRTIFGAAYLENPTPVDGVSGQAFDISAVGGMALANDEARSLLYATKDLTDFQKEPASLASSSVETGAWEDDDVPPPGTEGRQRIRAQFPGGSLVNTGDTASALNDAFRRGDMRLGGVRVGLLYGGRADANYALDFTTVAGIVTQVSMTATYALNSFVGDPNFPSGVDYFAFKLRRTGAATNVADDTTWGAWVDYSAVGQRMDRNGNLLVGSAGLGSAQTVLASQVAEDLLGRMLTMCDPATAQIDTTSFPIDQLAYLDGTKAAGVLDDLATFEPDWWWGVHETSDAGLHRFGFQRWATDPRYVVSTQDGYRESGSDSDLCNRVLVSWTDSDGKQQTTPVTAASLGLVGQGLPVDALGSRVKDADPVSLPDGRGSYANAVQVGAAVLRDKINPPKAATVTVTRPIEDRLTGNQVMPWELEPGWPVLVRETGNQLRCTEVNYDHDSRSAVLTLGTPVLTESQRIARLAAA